MSVSLATDIRHARLQVLADALDAASTAATLSLYSGAHPGAGVAPDSDNVLLATLTFSLPCIASDGIAGGVMTFEPFTGDEALADGTAAWARAADGDDNWVADFTSITVTGGGGDITLNTVVLVTGGPVSVTSATITEGNA